MQVDIIDTKDTMSLVFGLVHGKICLKVNFGHPSYSHGELHLIPCLGSCCMTHAAMSWGAFFRNLLSAFEIRNSSQTFVADIGHNYSAPYWMGEFGCGGDRCGNKMNKDQKVCQKWFRRQTWQNSDTCMKRYISAKTGRKLFDSWTRPTMTLHTGA